MRSEVINRSGFQIVIGLMLVALLVMPLAFVGCAGMSETQQRTVSGGAMGAAGGALIGAMAGDAAWGAAIGGMVGATGGFLYGKHKESVNKAYQEGYHQGQRTK